MDTEKGGDQEGKSDKRVRYVSFIRQFAIAHEYIIELLLGGAPPSLHHGAIYCTTNGRVVHIWRKILPHTARSFHVSHSQNVWLREMGLAPSCIARVGRRPDV
jgi:hypothetical protein